MLTKIMSSVLFITVVAPVMTVFLIASLTFDFIILPLFKTVLRRASAILS